MPSCSSHSPSHTPSNSPATLPESAEHRGPLPQGMWLCRYRGISLLLDRRHWSGVLLLLAALGLASLAYLCLGEQHLPPQTLWDVMLNQAGPLDTFVVEQLRLPRLLAALSTGLAFGLAGCLMQTLARNRLATPGIIGIDNGATAFAVASVLGMGLSLAPSAMALAGAATAAVLTFGLAAGGGARGYRFIVAGIGVGAIFGAVTQLMLSRAAIDVANAAYPWTVGTLNARPAGAVQVLGVGLLVLVPLALWLSRSLALMRFSDAVATGLGAPLKRRRAQVLVVSVALTALAVSVAGPVGMVGLLGPEVARHLCGNRQVPLLGAGLAGAMVMVVADLVGRLLLSPLELPVGIVTAVVGGPWLIWILVRR
ncbi:FecCD family ABC transporter permease [Halomonas litopenaei]|uniref:FecCD family ABC transporter permease n=1 Tax=Halomonas litopenaei TaxID=2109328 RepID=UPI001F5CB9BA|nr:iron ABC transporter permease [Halomonas litopenaei]